MSEVDRKHPDTVWNVLVVEDDRSHCEFISRILEQIGCHVTTAYNGKDALSVLARYNFDLVLMDVEMPEMNGLIATRRIHELRRHGDVMPVPVIAITSHQSAEMEKMCRDAGMADIIHKDIWKPKWEPAIREKLQRWVERPRDAQESGPGKKINIRT